MKRVHETRWYLVGITLIVLGIAAFSGLYGVQPVLAENMCCCTSGLPENSTNCSVSPFANDENCVQLQNQFNLEDPDIRLYKARDSNACTNAETAVTKSEPTVCCCPPVRGTGSTSSCLTLKQSECKAKTGWAQSYIGGSCDELPKTPDDKVVVQFTPQITIPGSNLFEAGKPITVDGLTLAKWISAVYMFLAGAISIVGAVMVSYGGYQWLTAGGNTGRVQEARNTIYSALIAIAIILASYVLLRTINPQLVQFKDLTQLVTYIEPEYSAVIDWSNPPARIAESIISGQTDPSEKDRFNSADCKALIENKDALRNGFEAYLTGYYKPGLNDSLGPYQSKECLIGMQCWCPPNTLPLCKNSRGLTWRPCSPTYLSQHPNDYCGQTASKDGVTPGSPPVGPYGESRSTTPEAYTAAADGCFGFGTTFTVEPVDQKTSSLAREALGRVWQVDDRGKDIRGTHFDLYMGTGQAQARPAALAITGKARIRILRLCQRQGACEQIQD